MIKQLLALCSAGIFCGTIALSPLTVSAEETSDYPSVLVEKSTALQSQPDSKITGEIAVLVHDHPVHVTITMYSSEKPVTYYDMEVAPQDGTSATEYVFLVDYSEYPSPDQLPTFDKQYTSDFLNGVYSSSYTITIAASDTKDAVYTEEGVLVADPHAETAVYGQTRYDYDVTFSETLESSVQAGDPDVQIADGNAAVSRSIQLLWKPYTLGDVDDNGKIEIQDAFLTLLYSSYLSVGSTPSITIVTDAADVNQDGTISITDAFYILMYYSKNATGSTQTFEEFLAEQIK